MAGFLRRAHSADRLHETRDTLHRFEHETLFHKHRTAHGSGLTRASMMRSHPRLACRAPDALNAAFTQKHDRPDSHTFICVTPTASHTLRACIPLAQSVSGAIPCVAPSSTLTSPLPALPWLCVRCLAGRRHMLPPSSYAPPLSPVCIQLAHNVWCGDNDPADSYLLASIVRRSAAALSLLILSR